MRARNVLLLLVLLMFTGTAQAADDPRWGRLYTLSGDVAVRETPSDTALKVRVLRAGQKVRVDFQDDGWTAVFDPKESVRSEMRALGYAKLAELRSRGALEFAQATSIEVHRPEAKPEARPEPMPAAKSEAKPQAKPAKPTAKSKTDEASKKSAKPFGEIRVADRALTVRKARGKDSEFVRLLKPGQPVRVDFLEDGWFAVFDPDELTRDLSKAWGFSRDKFLVPESAYAGPPSAPDEKPAPKPAKPGKESADDGAVGYSVIERKDVHRKSTGSAATLRVRLELSQPPAVDALKKIAREIWKAERRKNEDLELEVYLTGMDPQGLAYAVARFHEDGRLREFWWREVVLGKAKK